MMTALDLAAEDVPTQRRQIDLPAQLRVGEVGHSCRIRMLSAAGVELDVADVASARDALAEEAVVIIPSLGQYKARRMRKTGLRATYLFDLTEFSKRALGVLIADRFPE